MLDRLGPAINSGRGLFLFGPPGNGKTSIAERITAAFGREIWVPRAIGVDGEIIRVFDPVNHEEAPLTAGKGLLDQRPIDNRWVRIRAADDRRRRRADDGAARSDASTRPPASARPRCN